MSELLEHVDGDKTDAKSNIKKKRKYWRYERKSLNSRSEPALIDVSRLMTAGLVPKFQDIGKVSVATGSS